MAERDPKLSSRPPGSGSRRLDSTGPFSTERASGKRRRPGRVVVMRFEGHLDAPQAMRVLRQAADELDRLGHGQLLVDCRKMTDYDGEARRLFTDWNGQNRERVARVAVVTDKMLWHMVVRTIGLASRQDMKPFSELDPAFDWLSGRD